MRGEHHISFPLQLSPCFSFLCLRFLLRVFTSSLPFRSSPSRSRSPSLFCCSSSPPSQSASHRVLRLSSFILACGVRDPGVRCCMSSSSRWSPFLLPHLLHLLPCNWPVPRMEKIILLNSMQFKEIKRSRTVPHVAAP